MDDEEVVDDDYPDEGDEEAEITLLKVVDDEEAESDG